MKQKVPIPAITYSMRYCFDGDRKREKRGNNISEEKRVDGGIERAKEEH